MLLSAAEERERRWRSLPSAIHINFAGCAQMGDGFCFSTYRFEHKPEVVMRIGKRGVALDRLAVFENGVLKSC
jgi:hypothetical protein